MKSDSRSRSSVLNTEDFNPVAQALLAPFDDDQISERLMNPNKPESEYNKKFTYVDPAHYRRRFLEVFKDGFEFGLREDADALKEGETGVRGVYRFRGNVDGVEYVVPGVPVFEEWTKAADFFYNKDTQKYDLPNPKAGQVIGRSETYMMLTSAGYKAVAREIGVGLHLYDKPARKLGDSGNRSTSNTKPATSNGSSNGASSGEWTGDQLIGGNGKFKDKKWNDPEVDMGYLNFCIGKFGADSNAAKEQARRAANNVGEGQKAGAAAAAARAADPEDDGIPF